MTFLHFDEAKQAAIVAVRAWVGAASQDVHAMLIVDLFGKLRLVLWHDAAADTTNLGQNLVSNCSVWWTGEVLSVKDLDPVTQIFYEDMELEAQENGRRHVYRQRHASRMVFPQELRALVELAGGFDLVEWFYGFKPHLKLDRAHHPLLMVVVLRKK